MVTWKRMSTGKKVFVPNFSFFKSGVSLLFESSVLPALSEPGFSSFVCVRRKADRSVTHLVLAPAGR